MKLIVLAAVIALAVAAPADSDTTVLRQSIGHVDPTGYQFELVFSILVFCLNVLIKSETQKNYIIPIFYHKWSFYQANVLLYSKKSLMC